MECAYCGLDKLRSGSRGCDLSLKGMAPDGGHKINNICELWCVIVTGQLVGDDRDECEFREKVNY